LDDLIVGAYNASLSGKSYAGKSYVVFTKPPVGLLASAMALRLMALPLALPNTT
jgi:hypothetical protein